MTSNQIFTLPRFFNLFRAESLSGYKMTIIISSVVFAFLLLIATILASDHDSKDFHQIWFSIVLLGGGFYFTSTSFQELNRKEQRMSYLLTPASIFEKFSKKLLITTVGYVVGVTFLYWIFSGVTEAISERYFNYSFTAFNPFDDFFAFIIKLYLVIQSVFLLGAVTFNRFSFFKTLFSLVLLEIGLSLMAWLMIRIVFAEYFESFFVPIDNMSAMPSYTFLNFIEFTVWPLIQNIFWFLLAPVLWVVTYFKLKEREV